MKISQAIRDYLEYVEIEKGQSIYTLRNYQQYLERFSKFCQAQKIFEVRQIDNSLIRQFRKSMLRQTPPLKKNTQNYHLIALRNLLKYLQKQNIKTYAPDKIELAKVGEREINVLTPEELGRLLDIPKTARLKGLRDKAILETLFSTGLRVSELAKLERNDVNLKTGEFSVKGKGEKIRLVFLSAKAKEALQGYLDKRNDDQPALFIGPKGNRLTVRSIQRAVQTAAKQAGIVKKVTPHLLRHQFGTDLLSSGADLRSVQTLLGHSSVTTTQIYTHITNRDLRDVHAAFHGKQRQADQPTTATPLDKLDKS